MAKAKDGMTQCQTLKPFLVLDEFKHPTGKREMRWGTVDVSEISMVSEIRCLHCHGAVKAYKPKDGSAISHVDHKSREDSERCQGGHYFKGPEHQMSLNPLELIS